MEERNESGYSEGRKHTMTANEFRIGNWVNVTDKDYQVTQILERGVNCGHIGAMYDIVKPIPLTEEWLIKFGFENS